MPALGSGEVMAPALTTGAKVLINSAVGAGDVACAAKCPTFAG